MLYLVKHNIPYVVKDKMFKKIEQKKKIILKIFLFLINYNTCISVLQAYSWTIFFQIFYTF